MSTTNPTCNFKRTRTLRAALQAIPAAIFLSPWLLRGAGEALPETPSAAVTESFERIDMSPAADWRAIEGHLYRRVKLLTLSDHVKNPAKAKAVIEQARKDLAQHEDIERTKRMISMLEGMVYQPVVGGTLEIAFTALDGTEVDLAAMKGKVVLVDFWATRCGPCVTELPKVKAAYNKFHDKGFEVIGISLDQAEDKARLQSFIKKREHPWPQSFGGQGWNDAQTVKYGISAIPATFLIGKDGKIAGIGVGGHELEAKLAEWPKVAHRPLPRLGKARRGRTHLHPCVHHLMA